MADRAHSESNDSADGLDEPVREVLPHVRAMLEKPGIYIVGDSKAPDIAIPMISSCGRLYSVTYDAVMNPRRLPPTITVNGPFHPAVPATVHQAPAAKISRPVSIRKDRAGFEREVLRLTFNAFDRVAVVFVDATGDYQVHAFCESEHWQVIVRSYEVTPEEVAADLIAQKTAWMEGRRHG